MEVINVLIKNVFLAAKIAPGPLNLKTMRQNVFGEKLASVSFL